MGTLVILHRITDASQMYHSVRGQETLKLYVIFNVLEVSTKLVHQTMGIKLSGRLLGTDCGPFVLLVWSRFARLALLETDAREEG
jgi:hypothetical protein